jgi:hypothetical protein
MISAIKKIMQEIKKFPESNENKTKTKLTKIFGIKQSQF